MTNCDTNIYKGFDLKTLTYKTYIVLLCKTSAFGFINTQEHGLYLVNISVAVYVDNMRHNIFKCK